MLISYYIRRTYGNDRMYIANPSTARTVATLTGQRTIDYKHISALESLGHSFRQVSDPRHAEGDRKVYAHIPITVDVPGAQLDVSSPTAVEAQAAARAAGHPAQWREWMPAPVGPPWLAVAKDILAPLAPSEDSDL